MRQPVNGLPMAIYNECKNKDAAARFLGWFTTSSESVLAQGGMLRGVFPSQAQRDAAAKAPFGSDRILQQVLGVANFYNSLNVQNDKVDAQPENFNEWSKIYQTIRDKYDYNKINIDEMLKEIKEQADPVLAK